MAGNSRGITCQVALFRSNIVRFDVCLDAIQNFLLLCLGELLDHVIQLAGDRFGRMVDDILQKFIC